MSYALKAITVALSILCGAAGFAVAEPFEEGLKAFEGGNYPTAMRLLRPLAAEGSARAQYNVGVMYEEGSGVSIDYTEAVGWLLQAAEQGNSDAKSHLGFMYLYGRGVSQDIVSAHMWFDLAASEGNVRAVFAQIEEGSDQPRIGAGNTLAATNLAQVLTRKSRGQYVTLGELCQRPDVLRDLRAGEVASKNVSRRWVKFAEHSVLE